MERRRPVWPWLLGLGVLIVLCGCVVAATALLSLPTPGGRGAVAVVDIKGPIVTGPEVGGFGATAAAYSERVIADLQRAAEDPNIGAIVLDVDSGGGSVVASDDIYRALLEIQKPVVTSMAEAGASGAYYLACATDHIIARPSTTTGSIGVRMQVMRFGELLDTLGVEVENITSGPLKDIGSPYRPMTPEEQEILQTIIMEAYEDFVRVVAEGRDMTPERVRELADGRIYTGRQAVAFGLIDELGDLDDAIARASELAGLRMPVRVERYQRAPRLSDLLFEMRRALGGELAILQEIIEQETLPRLEYRAP
jgi:protease IV